MVRAIVLNLKALNKLLAKLLQKQKKKKRKLPLQLLVEMATKSNHQSKVASSLLRLKLVMQSKRVHLSLLLKP